MLMTGGESVKIYRPFKSRHVGKNQYNPFEQKIRTRLFPTHTSHI